MNRRDFIRSSAALLATASFPAAAENVPSAVTKRSIKKAITWPTVNIQGSVLEKMRVLKAAGFEGVEMLSHMDQEEVLRARDDTGLVIPSVCGARHWKFPLSDGDPAVRAEALAALEQSLRDAQRYGATSVLLVPAVVTKEVTYEQAYVRSQTEIRKAIPLAEKLDVKIACENVWNNFLLTPLEAARYVDEFKSPAVGWHFDVGNSLNYGWPEQWIRILGRRIQKLHIKEFSRKKRDEQGLWKGFQVPFLEGDNDWPAVMKALDDIGYHGWGIAEQPGGDTADGLKDLSNRMSRIFAS